MGAKVFLTPTPYPTEVQELTDLWDEFASVSVSCWQPRRSAEEHLLLNGPAVSTWDFTSEYWRPDWSFVACCPQGLQCAPEHQLCWASSLLRWSNSHPAFYIAWALLSGQSRNTSTENLVHVWPRAREVAAHLVAQLIRLLAWKLPHVHSSMRSQCKDLVWSHSFWKDQLKIC